MGTRIPTPHIYVNLHQTVWVALAASVVTAYIFNFKDFRNSVNILVNGGSR